jgi:acyl-homoserine-lactone acylase
MVWSSKMRVHLFTILFVLHLVVGTTSQAKPDKSLLPQAEVLWDTWGVPHIFAKDTNGAARALGWA